MTVKELIEELSKYDPDLPVGYNDTEYGWTTDQIDVYQENLGNNPATNKDIIRIVIV